jgi:hypothetical protein
MKNLILKRALDVAILITLVLATSQTASARVHGNFAVPDAGSTSLLMVMACSALAAVRRIVR